MVVNEQRMHDLPKVLAEALLHKSNKPQFGLGERIRVEGYKVTFPLVPAKGLTPSPDLEQEI